MRKIRLIIFPVVIFVLCILFAPSILNADHIGPIKFSGNGHYYELIEDLSWEDSRDKALSLGGYLATITSQEEADFIYDKFGHIWNIWIGGYQPSGTTEPNSGWEWVTGEPWIWTNWDAGEPSDFGDDEDVLELVWGDKWNDNSGWQKYHFIVEYNKKPGGEKVAEPEPEIWVRNHEMTCFQVWINEDNCFEFVFWWEYANNNHIQIYDIAGNLVWETDFLKGQSHFIADLPNGIYTVKTFHEYGHILQEFEIGKP